MGFEGEMFYAEGYRRNPVTGLFNSCLKVHPLSVTVVALKTVSFTLHTIWVCCKVFL